MKKLMMLVLLSGVWVHELDGADWMGRSESVVDGKTFLQQRSAMRDEDGDKKADDVGEAAVIRPDDFIEETCASLIERYGPDNVLFYPKDDDLSPDAAHLRAFWGCFDVVRGLIVRGANIGAINANGDTPLCHAASSGCVERVVALLDTASVDQIVELVKKTNAFGNTALHGAVKSMNPKVIRALLERIPADQQVAVVEIRDKYGWTALHRAVLNVERFGVELIQELLRGIPVDKRVALMQIRDYGLQETALHEAATYGLFESGEALLKALESDLDRCEIAQMRDMHGTLAITSAFEGGHYNMVRLLAPYSGAAGPFYLRQCSMCCSWWRFE